MGGRPGAVRSLQATPLHKANGSMGMTEQRGRGGINNTVEAAEKAYGSA